MTESTTAPRSIGGWLVVPLAGLVLTLLGQVNSLPRVWAAVRGDTWQRLTSPESQQYHALWAPTLMWRVLESLSLITFAIVLLYYFAKKERALPGLMIAWYVVTVVFGLVDIALSSIIASHLEVGAIAVFSSAAAFLWLTYFLKSKRVRATFVN